MSRLSSYSSLSPPIDTSVWAASRAVARASVGDVSTSAACSLARAAIAAQRNTILWTRSSGVGGFMIEQPGEKGGRGRAQDVRGVEAEGRKR